MRKRTLAARAFDEGGMMVKFELVEGTKLEDAIERHFADPRAAYFRQMQNGLFVRMALLMYLLG